MNRSSSATTTPPAALRIVSIYAVFSLLWISSSESFITWYTQNPELIMRLGIAKGYVFILLTAALLYLLIGRHIRQMKQAEESLRESEQRFRSIFELAAVGVALVESQTGRFVKVNAKFCEITGFSEQQLLERGFQDITHPDDLPTDLNYMARLLAGELESYTREKRYIHREGSVVWVSITVSPQWQAGDEQPLQIAVVEDITRRKEAEQALSTSDERLTMALAASRMGAWEWRIQEGRLFWSPECYEMFGTREFDGSLSSFTRWLHPEDAGKVKEAIDRALEQGSTYAVEFRVVRPDGEVRWLSDLGRPDYDAQGRPLRLTGTVQDITERKLAEEALRENRELLFAVIDGAADAIFLKDREGRYQLANPATLAFLGTTAGELLGKTTAEVHPDPEIAAVIMEHDRRVLTTGEIEVCEETVETSSGRRTFIASKFPRRDAEGRITGLISVSHDITDRKEFEEQQKATIELLRLCNRAESLPDLMRDLALFFQQFTGCEAIGVRLRQGYDYPYFETRGFAEEFVLAETTLCTFDREGRVIRDPLGNPSLSCMCGNVLEGRFDPSLPFFTARGSFWTGSSTQVVAGAPESQLLGTTRNRCNKEGYQSVALIPIRFQGEKIGLMQFNDRRTGHFTREKIGQLEDLIDYLAVALAKLRSDEALNRSEQSLLEAQNVAGFGTFSYEIQEGSWSGTPILEGILGIEAASPRAALSALLPEEERGETLEHFARVLQGEPLDRECRIVRGGDGAERWVHVMGRLECDAQGAPARVIGIVRDVTARRLAEQEKAELEAQLQQAQKMESVGRLAGGVAHDFNNMLSVILGHAGLAEMELEPGQPLFCHLEEIRKAAERSAGLTRQLLAFARKQAIVPEVLDLNAGVTGVLSMLKRLIGEAIQLNWLPGEGLWPVKMDPSQLDQILANLCVNSRDAIASVGAITIATANCAADQAFCSQHPGMLPGDYVQLCVGDDGAGMDRETVAHIFEPFFTTKEVGKGTGLGLAMVYGAVQQNGGYISASSEPGAGTLFSIYLPRHLGAPTGPSAPPSAPPVPRGRETILLVEDELAILHMTTLALAGQGYTVLQANSPDQAVALALEHSGGIDLLLTDVVMPQMNGLELAHQVTALCPELRCLFMSGYTADVIADHGVLDPGVQFINKPFVLTELASKVREVLDTP